MSLLEKIGRRSLATMAGALALGLSGCGGGGSSSSGAAAAPSGFEFAPATQAQIAAVAQSINARDRSARNVSVVHEDTSDGLHTLRIVRHTVNGVDHYGAITVPTVRVGAKFPVLVELDGWPDDTPPLDVAQVLRWQRGQPRDAIFVMPSFRGRAIQFAGRTWKSGGDVCDAFDGAADDAMALVSALQSIEPLADTSRLMVRGGSRGGGVALLLGQRDPRVRVVQAEAAPVDFYRADAAAAYGDTYKCQFFNGKTAEQSRQAMIAASALHFPMLPSVSKVYLEHGSADPIVPVLNATEMNKRLVADGANVELTIYNGAGHSLGFTPDFLARRDANFYAFIKP